MTPNGCFRGSTVDLRTTGLVVFCMWRGSGTQRLGTTSGLWPTSFGMLDASSRLSTSSTTLATGLMQPMLLGHLLGATGR